MEEIKFHYHYCKDSVPDNKVLRGMLGPMRDEITGQRKLHKNELHNFHSLPNIVNNA